MVIWSISGAILMLTEQLLSLLTHLYRKVLKTDEDTSKGATRMTQ